MEAIVGFIPTLPCGRCPLLRCSAFRPSLVQKSRRSPSRTAVYRKGVAVVSSATKAYVNEFKEWISYNDGQLSEALDFSRIDDRSKRGVFVSSRSKVLSGTELAVLPEGTYIGTKEAKQLLADVSPAVDISKIIVENEVYIALAILLERGKGQDSYEPFLKSIPKYEELDCAPLWSDDDLEMLNGSAVYQDVKKWQEDSKEEWASLDKTIFSKDRKVFPEEFFSLRDFQWALCVVFSRGFYVSQSEPYVIAPIACFLSPPAFGSKPSSALEVKGGLFFSQERLVLSAQTDLKDGELVSIRYGKNMRNAELAIVRGLVIEDRYASSVSLSFKLAELDPFYDDKLDIVETARVEQDPKFEIVGDTVGNKYQAPDDLDTFLRLLCLTGKDSFLLEAVFRRETWGFMGLPVSAENEKMVCELVVNACEDAIGEYTYQWGDKAQESLSVRERMAFCIVEEEKNILKDVALTYRRRLTSLDGLEYYAERRLNALDLLRPIDESENVDSESGGRVGRAFDENY